MREDENSLSRWFHRGAETHIAPNEFAPKFEYNNICSQISSSRDFKRAKPIFLKSLGGRVNKLSTIQMYQQESTSNVFASSPEHSRLIPEKFDGVFRVRKIRRLPWKWTLSQCCDMLNNPWIRIAIFQVVRAHLLMSRLSLVFEMGDVQYRKSNEKLQI
ncbi:hypothetical protein C0J52_18775 [Blattella germanica]|nr:hypothetical protein C0J52_18775 [Blattella germanica]